MPRPVRSDEEQDFSATVSQLSDEGLNVNTMLSVLPVKEDVLAVPRPAIPEDVLAGKSPQQLQAIKEFQDVNIDRDRAALACAYLPLTNALTQPPSQIVIFGFGVCFLANMLVVLHPDYLEPGGQALFFVALATSAVCSFVGFILARCGKPRYTVIAMGTLSMCWAVFILLDIADQEVVQCTESDDTSVGCMATSAVGTVILIAVRFVSFFVLAGVLLLNERRWAAAFIFMSICKILCGVIFLVAFEPSPEDFIPEWFWSLVFACPAMGFLYRRRVATWSTLHAMKQDQALFDEAWLPTQHQSVVSLRFLALMVSGHRTERKAQETDDLKLLYQHAFALDDWYQGVVRSWAEICTVEHSPAPVKSYWRALEKVHRSYSGQVPRLLDIVRSSIVVETILEATLVLELVSHEARVHAIKNRLDLAYDRRATYGYRDINLKIGFSELDGTMYEGFVFELQIHLRAIIGRKTDLGHKRYVALRNTRGK